MPNILLGVTGGIAAYKSVHLLRLLQKAGHSVRVVMTASGAKFVGPLTFQALTHYPAYVDEFETHGEALSHIELAKWADAVVIAPATANTIAKISSGIADNLLTSLVLANTKPLLIFPAMNGNMYGNAATQANIATLKSRGAYVYEPATGALACGDTAKGKLMEPEDILASIQSVFNTIKTANGLRVLITAGPTVENIDPVRFVSNRSSGKMGYAIAEAASKAGASVTLISGPVTLASPVPDAVKVNSAAEMLQAVQAKISDCDIFIMAAAVADYTPISPANSKIKKSDKSLTLELTETADILKTVSAAKKQNQVFIGFAAETDNLLENASKKLKSKNLDFIAANDVSRSDIGFNSDNNDITMLYADGRRTATGTLPKKEVAEIIVDEAVKIFRTKAGL